MIGFYVQIKVPPPLPHPRRNKKTSPQAAFLTSALPPPECQGAVFHEVVRRMDYLILKLITNYDQTGDGKSLCYKWLDVEEFPKDHLIKCNHLRLIKTF